MQAHTLSLTYITHIYVTGMTIKGECRKTQRVVTCFIKVEPTVNAQAYSAGI